GPGGDREFDIGVSNARAERRMLVQDICMMLVPPQVAREASTATMLRHAVRQVPAEETSTLDDVVRCLQEIGDDESRELGNLLLDTAEMPLATLFFGSPAPGLLGSDATFTVITMAGLRLPDLKIEREYWSAEEALALPMLHTAHRLAVRRCYGGDMGRRKLVGLDEAHFMEGWRSGRSFLVRLARDSRKWNLGALVASPNPGDILGLDVQNLVTTVLLGRSGEASETAAEALSLLRRPAAMGLAALVGAMATLFAGAPPAWAGPRYAPDVCTTDQWRDPSQFQHCVDQLQDLSQQRAQCLAAPTPSAPDSGMAGWFANRSDAYDHPGVKGLYTRYGYAGYSYTTYDIGCVP